MGKFNRHLLLSLLIAGTLGSGCANFTTDASREVAAQQTYQELMADPGHNTTFNEIFNDEDATKRYLQFFTRLGRMYYRNQMLINQFDEKLAAGENPMKSSLYGELWTARNLKDRLEDKLTFHILKLREVELTGSDEDAKKSRIILGSMGKILNRLEEHQKLPFVDVLEQVNSYSISTPRGAKKGRLDRSLDPLKAPMSEFLRPNFDWQEFFDENAQKIEAETKAQVKERGFYKELEKAGDSSRTPDSVQVFPSSGKSGNMFGYRLDRGNWALTFDDGPRRETTGELLDYLHDNDFKATFFWLAQNAKRYPDMIAKAQKYGMELANHSYSHANIPKLSRSGTYHEIVESTEELEALYNHKVKFFRLPYGAGVNSNSIRQMIAERGMIHVYWSVDSLDWQDKNPRKIFNRVQMQMENEGRGIILFHDIHSQSVEATKMLVRYAQGEGLNFMTMTEAVDSINNPVQADLPENSYRVRTDLNVRVGYSSNYARCAVLPAGTIVQVLSRSESYVKIEVLNPSSALENDLRDCYGKTMVHRDYIDKI